MSDPILELREVATHFAARPGLLSGRSPTVTRAVDGVSLVLQRGEVLGLVGESGSGKSTLARTILQLVPTTGGSVILDGANLTTARPADIQIARRKMQMVFQDPFASLNPRLSVQETIAEPLIVHGLVPREKVAARISELMALVGLAPRFMRKYPHEFSGGQRQRIAIARALAMEPTLLIADEPVSALDVSIQAQILNLLSQLVREMRLSMIFITHDLSVVKHISDRIAVLYRGKLVEIGEAVQVIEHPRHAYTQSLVASMPRLRASS